MEENQNTQQLQSAPNATISLVLGILSIVLGCAIIGLILGIIGLVYANKGKKIYNSNPSLYTNYGILNAGYILSIIGTVLGGLSLLYWIIVVGVVGIAATASQFVNWKIITIYLNVVALHV